jgi:hypothetical protein
MHAPDTAPLPELIGARVRIACTFSPDERRWASNAVGVVWHASRNDATGRIGLDVDFRTGCKHVPAGKVVPEDAKRDPDGYLIEDEIPDPDVADFAASLAIYGAAWRGDVREAAAWHAEQPARSGWWDPWRKPPYFSLTVRQMCEYRTP